MDRFPELERVEHMAPIRVLRRQLWSAGEVAVDDVCIVDDDDDADADDGIDVVVVVPLEKRPSRRSG